MDTEEENVVQSLSHGFYHGVEFFEFVRDNGIDFLSGEFNAFHSYFLSLEQSESSLQHHLNLDQAVQWLISHNVPGEAVCCSDHNVPMTPLHHCLSFVNYPLGVSSVMVLRRDLKLIQERFDCVVYNCVKLMAMHSGEGKGFDQNSLLIHSFYFTRQSIDGCDCHCTTAASTFDYNALQM